ncbi:type 1 glutamine amidotransferase domain-containing protein [Geodermatophilus ruber]|uniref:Putative intracellular protease/amidase n=1 Tax=Geodermatophilus ruber TaxID=504800 RepID=A0A1I4E9D0_9ACTN|nr:type 1 glutamine amidotransferase domain-containing protein [Geodermatophilus ruber]SFL01207.1 Putative intracellular protease/amidase [Geodermatophilus ruber]
MPAVLIVLSAADHWTLKDGTRHPTGFWAEEFLVPHGIFREAGIDVVIATPGGTPPTVDQRSLDPEMAGGEERAAQLRAELDALSGALAAPARLEDQSPGEYDAIFIPGGHGPMEDLAVSTDLGRLLLGFLDAARIVSSVCHGPAGLLPAVRPDGTWAFVGRELTAFTNEEEAQAGLADKAPWLLEDRLRAAGARFRSGPAWAPFVVVDGDLVTGQNPASSREAAERVVGLLQARAAQPA